MEEKRTCRTDRLEEEEEDNRASSSLSSTTQHYCKEVVGQQEDKTSGRQDEGRQEDEENSGRGAKVSSSGLVDVSEVADGKEDEDRGAEPTSSKGIPSSSSHKSGADDTTSRGKVSPPSPPPVTSSNSGKPSQHLDTSKEPIAVVMRAVSFVYRRIVAKTNEGGMKDFFEQHWTAFDVEGDEHRVEWTVLFKEYETLIDKAMSDFAQEEGLEVEVLFDMIKERVEDDDKRISKFADMLVAAGGYNKFVQMMRSKAKANRKKV